MSLAAQDDLKQMIVNELTWNQAREFILGSPYLDAFRCKIGSRGKEGAYNPYGLPLIDLMKSEDGRKRIDVAMRGVISVARGLGWKESNEHQRSLAAAVGHLMGLMKIGVEPEIASIAKQMSADFQPGGTSSSSRSTVAECIHPLNTKVLDDGCRYLYMIQVTDCMVFKLGTFLADHARGRKTMLDRYLGREKPPALPTCTPVNWLGDSLVVKHLMKTSIEDEKPDKPIHAKLRELAKDQDLLNCGQTEFHDRALWFNCKQMVDEMAIPDVPREPIHVVADESTEATMDEDSTEAALDDTAAPSAVDHHVAASPVVESSVEAPASDNKVRGDMKVMNE